MKGNALRSIEYCLGKELISVVKSIDKKKWLLVFEGDSLCQIGMMPGFERGMYEIADDLDGETSEYREDDLIDAGVIDPPSHQAGQS